PMFRQVARYEDLSNDYVADVDEVTRMGRLEDEPTQLRARLHKLLDASRLLEGTKYQELLRRRWADWEKLPAKELQRRLDQLFIERRKLLDARADYEAKSQPVPADLARRLDEVSFDIDLGSFERLLRRYGAQEWKKLANPQLQQIEQMTEL